MPSRGRSQALFYNAQRPHSSLGGGPPDEAYAVTGGENEPMTRLAA